MDKLNQIIKALREWGRGQEVPYVHAGLCWNLRPLWNMPNATTDDLLQEAFLSWPHYSGSRKYPVPDPEVPSDEVAACTIYYAHENLWDYSPYGNLRRELCLHVADWLETNKSKILPLFEEKPHD